ncbi:MAG: HAMP domain-containing histidine kinase [Prevotellaceae bacterium]|jgi:signal transduction histidine kinase|nr:HAMP domain-containing histidine kinase [Prevotellaceae bacterium]
MYKRSIILLAVVISICTLGLISVQVQWIQATEKVEKAQFSRTVMLILEQVVNNITAQEMREIQSVRMFQSHARNGHNLVPVEQRISYHQIELLLHKACSEMSIPIACDFAVTDELGAILFETDNFSKALPEHTYSMTLFPDDPEDAAHYYLNVYFPQYAAYVIHSIMWMIVASVLLTLIIIATFAATLFIIFRQKRLSKIKADFVNNITHELKTPITTISLAAQMLQETPEAGLSTAVPRLSDMIGKESKRLSQLVESILQSAIFKRGVKLSVQKIDMHALLQNVLAQFSLQFDTLGVTVKCAFHATNTHVLGDEIHLANAVSNLIDNAIKYRKETTPLHILIETENTGKTIITAVTDNGVGVKATKQLFHQFYRHQSENMYTIKGFGLGLYYVKNIIETHHGKLFASGNAGAGSTFGFELPVCKEDATGRHK